MKITVVIPTHNRADALDLSLKGLAQQQLHAAWEVIVVNNCCTDDTDHIVSNRSFPVPLRLVHEPVPGPAAARLAMAVEVDKLMDGHALPHQDIQRLESWLR